MTPARGEPSNRDDEGDFSLEAPAVIVASGGIGGNHDLVRKNWPEWLGTPPKKMLSGVPAHVDGRMLGIAEKAGAHLINGDRMWHYVEGIENHSPVWDKHGIRILPGPSSLWFDATGKRLPVPLFPGFDTLGTLSYLRSVGHDHSWFVLTQSDHREGVRALGQRAEPRPDRQEHPRAAEAAPRQGRHRARRGVQDRRAPTSWSPTRSTSCSPGMRKLHAEGRRARHAGDPPRDRGARPRARQRLHQGRAGHRDARRPQLPRRQADPRGEAAQDPRPRAPPAHRRQAARRSRARASAASAPICPAQALAPDGTPIPGLYAVGEASGFGGGGIHGYRALEGTFLGGCLFTGRQAGRAIAGTL